MPPLFTVVVIAVAVFVLMWLYTFFFFLKIWIRALMAGSAIPIARLMGMKLRRVPPGLIVDCHIRASKAGLGVTLDQLEAHYLAGGRPERVIDALVKVRNRDIPVPFETMAKTDLAGFNVDEIDPEEFRKTVSQ